MPYQNPDDARKIVKPKPTPKPDKPAKKVSPTNTVGIYAMGSGSYNKTGVKVDRPKSPSKPKDNGPKDSGPKATAGAYAMGAGKENKTGVSQKDIQKAASRRITSPSNPTNKKYRGKYAGPDEFKGNTKMIAAWKAAGSPGKGKVGAQAKKDFAKNFKG